MFFLMSKRNKDIKGEGKMEQFEKSLELSINIYQVKQSTLLITMKT